MLIDIHEWLETEITSRPAGARQSIDNLAKDVLRRRLKRIRKEGKHLDNLSALERHKLRIKTKKIRYALEFFDGLFPGKHEQKELARLSAKLKTLHGALGSLNDFAAHCKMTKEAALGAPRAHMSGVILGREDEAARSVLKAALDAPQSISEASGRAGYLSGQRKVAIYCKIRQKWRTPTRDEFAD